MKTLHRVCVNEGYEVKTIWCLLLFSWSKLTCCPARGFDWQALLVSSQWHAHGGNLLIESYSRVESGKLRRGNFTLVARWGGRSTPTLCLRDNFCLLSHSWDPLPLISDIYLNTNNWWYNNSIITARIWRIWKVTFSVCLSVDTQGLSQSGPGGWVPGQVRLGGGIPQSGMGYPPSRDGGYPPSRDGVPPPGIGQQMEHLISGMRYASCVNAGELSCLR